MPSLNVLDFRMTQFDQRKTLKIHVGTTSAGNIKFRWLSGSLGNQCRCNRVIQNSYKLANIFTWDTKNSADAIELLAFRIKNQS